MVLISNRLTWLRVRFVRVIWVLHFWATKWASEISAFHSPLSLRIRRVFWLGGGFRFIEEWKQLFDFSRAWLVAVLADLERLGVFHRFAPIFAVPANQSVAILSRFPSRPVLPYLSDFG